MFKRTWKWVSTIGIDKSYSDDLVKRIELTNQFSVIAIIVFFFSGINNLILGDLFSAAFIETLVLTCFVGFYLNYKRYHSFAISFLFVTISFAIFYFDSYSGLLSGSFLYYFPLILAIGFVFDVKENKIILLLHFSLVVLCAMVNVFTNHQLFTNSFINDEIRHQMFMFNLLFSILSVGFFIYLTQQNNKNLSQSYNQRITERKEGETLIKQALLEKEVLLSELHHRVKNNLAIISGLFSLRLNAAIHEDAKSVLLESKNRVMSIALIHNLLYKNSNMVDINIENYLNDLITEIQMSYPAISNSIAIKKSISSFHLNINAAVPCGLILNEVLTNCYKHAFVHRSNGLIDICFTKTANLLRLVVKDDGVGLKKNYKESASIGLTIIQALTEQLEGRHLFYHDHSGTGFELYFNGDDK